ncbi:glycine/betaine ABC transporter permease [Nocardioides baekrokdamisoli]|uniref:Glycine/betaine ABC transporter permease n=1 Tax=Nocardioides baekrokdamisoli TaxID=1804624 RepID=A0A3G9IKH1_9ACTN|nr:ABC transporter permease subunit [Nocardioides baekrokdamisoli]BBH16575.1 glycine/betaine ABC transporter permease [Nocardioides baekrokdamisoli]
MRWLSENFPYVRGLLWQHAWLSILPIVIGLAVAVPVGWWASRHRRWRGLILGFGGLVYTLPSLPLLIVLPGLLGTSFLDPINVVVVLSAYAAALLVRTATDAFSSVPEVVIESARAAGYSRWQQVVGVELPLAGPVLLAGLRVASVSTVSLVTVGALIGVSNLGALFTDGFQRGFNTEIVIGVVGVVGLALALDLLWLGLARLAMPWRVRGAA